MRGEKSKCNSRLRHTQPLVVRGGLARTFGGLASFLAVIFLSWGIYILEDALANPVAAQAAAVIAAAFSIALATILLFYVLKPGKNTGAAVPQRASRVLAPAKKSFLSESSKSAKEDDSRKDLAYQRIYVDHTRIPPRAHI